MGGEEAKGTMPDTFSVTLTIFEPSHVRLAGLAVATPEAPLRARLWQQNLWAYPRVREHAAFEDGLRVIQMRAPWIRRRAVD